MTPGAGRMERATVGAPLVVPARLWALALWVYKLSDSAGRTEKPSSALSVGITHPALSLALTQNSIEFIFLGIHSTYTI